MQPVTPNVYAKCIDGQEAEMNNRIMKGLGEEEMEQDMPEE
ncbi:hypothetical protein [Streptomyces botrytidirepellens]|nr:hypothetical protein [Streptomyces botrytidirepellens]